MKADAEETPKVLRYSSSETEDTQEANLRRRATIVIGRGPECDVVVNDVKASRKHCRLTRRDEAFVLEDLNSKNGTYVEGQKIVGSVLLKKDQTFKIGDTILYLA